MKKLDNVIGRVVRVKSSIFTSGSAWVEIIGIIQVNGELHLEFEYDAGRHLACTSAPVRSFSL